MEKENDMRMRKRVLLPVLDMLRQFLIGPVLSPRGTYLLGFIGVGQDNLIPLALQLLVVRLELLVLQLGSPREGQSVAG